MVRKKVKFVLSALFFAVFVLTVVPVAYAVKSPAGKLISIESIGSVKSAQDIEVLMRYAGAEKTTMSSALGGYGTVENSLAAGVQDPPNSISTWFKIFEYLKKNKKVAAELMKLYKPYFYKVTFKNLHGNPFNSRLEELLNGDDTGDDITALMKTAEPDDGKGYQGPISIATEKFKNALNTQGSDLNNALIDNTVFLKGVSRKTIWRPVSSVHFLFAHNKNDDSVPVGNTLAVQKAVKEYSNANVEFDIFEGTEPLSAEEYGTVHGATIVQAYVRGMAHILKHR